MFNNYGFRLNIYYFCLVVVNDCYDKVITTKSLFIYWLGCLKTRFHLKARFLLPENPRKHTSFLFKN